MAMKYLRVRGIPYLAERDVNGNPGPFRDLGSPGDFTIGLEAQNYEHFERRSGNDLSDLRLVTQLSASLTAVLDEVSTKNLALALYGAEATLATGSYTSGTPDTIATTLPAAGDILRLAKPKASSIVIKDSTGTPKTLVAGTNYSVLSADHGTIRIDNLTTGGPYVAPLKAEYSYTGGVNVNMFASSGKEYFVKIDGKNMADGGKPVLVELYRWSPNPASNLALFQQDGISGLELNGGLLYDSVRAADAVLGAFGRIVDLS